MKAPLDNSRSASKYVVKTAKVLDVFATGKAHITLLEESSVFQIPHCYLPALIKNASFDECAVL